MYRHTKKNARINESYKQPVLPMVLLSVKLYRAPAGVDDQRGWDSASKLLGLTSRNPKKRTRTYH